VRVKFLNYSNVVLLTLLLIEINLHPPLRKRLKTFLKCCGFRKKTCPPQTAISY